MSVNRRFLSAIALVVASSVSFAADPPKGTPAPEAAKKVETPKKPEAGKKEEKKTPVPETAPKKTEKPKPEGC
ncbi:MAG: hypothetical protein IT186_03590 [Acidobacteria bacterium]|nr:hypothetical protein [Acidobacteriota bacterium]MCK6680801.1 hypothetical protein [Thermoanaerobaculia bacterium]